LSDGRYPFQPRDGRMDEAQLDPLDNSRAWPMTKTASLPRFVA
jgi:hypothetical protein